MGGRIMKKKLGIALALAMVLAALMAGNALAVNPPWYICNVVATGASGTESWVMLTDTGTSGPGGTPAFTNRWFKLNANTAKQLLATTLTSSAASLRIIMSTQSIAAQTTLDKLYTLSDNYNP
jgi:hypothetical protein